MKRFATATIAAVGLVVSMVAAQQLPAAGGIVQQLKGAMEPAKPSLRTLNMTLSDLGETVRFTGIQARKQLPTGNYMLIVMTAPDAIAGTAMLLQEPTAPGQGGTLWTYAPTIGRVRKMLPIQGYDNFLDSDFTFADLGFVRLHKNYTTMSAETLNGAKTWKIAETIPQEQYYYSKVVTWVSADNYLPVKREYYDPAGQLWKSEAFDTVTTIEGIPTVLHVRMKDVMMNTASDLKITDVDYDSAIPDALFDWKQLPKVLDNPALKPLLGAQNR